MSAKPRTLRFVPIFLFPFVFASKPELIATNIVF
jgi:hypothetical protein